MTIKIRRAIQLGSVALVAMVSGATTAAAQFWPGDFDEPAPPRWQDRGYDEPIYREPRFERRFRRFEDERWAPDERRGSWSDDDAEEDREQRRKAWRGPNRRDDDDDDDERASGGGEEKITADGGARPSIAPLAPRQVAFAANYAQGSVVVDQAGRALYYVIAPGRAYRYPISVGKEGFSWTGTEKVSRVADWPDWHPPAEMRERKPELPEKMTGGIKNPLGAKAIYLGNTLYRIHGTNDPKSIGRAESSGCIRMSNQHAVHLGSIVSVGTPVYVVRSLGRGEVAER